jgi:HK97 gp10 family phage protein
MAKRITAKQLAKALKTAPAEVTTEAKKFLQRGLSEYKRVAVQGSPWRVGQQGGGVPRASGNLREMHYTKIKGLSGRFGVNPSKVRYAEYVHGGTRKMKKRPWLDYAFNKSEKQIEKHYKVFMDNILSHIAG